MKPVAFITRTDVKRVTVYRREAGEVSAFDGGQ